MQENSVDDWQASKNCVKERTTHLFNNELLSDIHFIVGEKSDTLRFPAHKLVLSIGSCVFNAMFNGALASDIREIEISDVEPSTFYALLRFLYTDTIELTDHESAISILYAAKKYMVLSLQIECVKFLSNNLSPKNAIHILKQALLYNERSLEEKCWALIDRNSTAALATEDFINLDLDTLCLILIRDTLGINEAKLFQKILEWSIAECDRKGFPISSDNQATVLGRALKLIRFPLMTAKEFSSSAARSGLLTKDEIISIFLCISENTKQSTTFIDIPRTSYEVFIPKLVINSTSSFAYPTSFNVHVGREFINGRSQCPF